MFGLPQQLSCGWRSRYTTRDAAASTTLANIFLLYMFFNSWNEYCEKCKKYLRTVSNVPRKSLGTCRDKEMYFNRILDFDCTNAAI